MDYGRWTDLEMALIRNLTNRAILADHAESAEGLLERMTGLLSRSSLREGEALIFPRCSSIHTCFMRFPIDVLFLKIVHGSGLRAEGEAQSPEPRAPSRLCGIVVKIAAHVQPFRVAWGRGADTVVELPAGTMLRTATQAGDLLEMSGDSVGPTCQKDLTKP